MYRVANVVVAGVVAALHGDLEGELRQADVLVHVAVVRPVERKLFSNKCMTDKSSSKFEFSYLSSGVPERLELDLAGLVVARVRPKVHVAGDVKVNPGGVA